MVQKQSRDRAEQGKSRSRSRRGGLKFRIGDICITQNSKAPEVNNGQVVVIVGINPGFVGKDGVEEPYVIQRVDGRPHAVITDRESGALKWYRASTASCQERKLRKPRTGEFVEEVVCAADREAS